eukprot:CAMPEP_0197544026 /NCGR_PEP_ID=MMETSP1318-20131121/68552_1 /TAXON_ID=552666 /ORGANISM="Partenskyella glossopodia, Strain RCC365" /LENGTH=186 /DNA_ID=CAMNT_0043103401 /DNA_START=748 /DNA_END=1306 /DNA_ORIENTATION=-
MKHSDPRITRALLACILKGVIPKEIEDMAGMQNMMGDMPLGNSTEAAKQSLEDMQKGINDPNSISPAELLDIPNQMSKRHNFTGDDLAWASSYLKNLTGNLRSFTNGSMPNINEDDIPDGSLTNATKGMFDIFSERGMFNKEEPIRRGEDYKPDYSNPLYTPSGGGGEGGEGESEAEPEAPPMNDR